MNDGIAEGDTRILSIAAIEHTVFAGMNHGLYRLRSGMWKKIARGHHESHPLLGSF